MYGPWCNQILFTLRWHTNQWTKICSESWQVENRNRNRATRRAERNSNETIEDDVRLRFICMSVLVVLNCRKYFEMCMHLKWHKHAQTLTCIHTFTPIYSELSLPVFGFLRTFIFAIIFTCTCSVYLVLGQRLFGFTLWFWERWCAFLYMLHSVFYFITYTKMVNRLPCQIGFMLTTHWPKTVEKKTTFDSRQFT